jgi:hypothetical protein
MVPRQDCKQGTLTVDGQCVGSGGVYLRRFVPYVSNAAVAGSQPSRLNALFRGNTQLNAQVYSAT